MKALRLLRLSFKLSWIWLLMLGTAACLPSSRDYASQSSLLAALERKSGRIAYVGVDGNIYTINQGGADQQSITDDARPVSTGGDNADALTYLFPTWSGDSQMVAFAEITGPLTESTGSAVYVAAADGSEVRELYRSEFTQPIYLYWSPDDEYLTFLTSSASGGLLLHIAAATGGDVEVLDAGQPYYWSWSPMENRMLIHAGGSGIDRRLSFLTLQNPVIEEGLEVQPSLFQAPAWSPDGRQLMLSGDNGTGQNTLMLIDSQNKAQKDLVDLPDTRVAFAWSPDSQRVAYISTPETTEQQADSVVGTLTVIDLERPDEPLVWEDDPVLAFFWSPNSKKIAFFVPKLVSVGTTAEGSDSQQNTVRVLVLYVMDAGSGRSEQVQIFQPTPELMSILPYFDQYHLSATIWSPDSQNVVVTGYVTSGPPAVLVINASGELDPRPIADGRLAFWSWE
jgi:Tol biopolymer transport system component